MYSGALGKSIYDMMTSSNGNIFRVTALCVGNPHKGKWRGPLMFSLMCAWINISINNREDGDLRGDRAHHDVIVMKNLRNEIIWKQYWFILIDINVSYISMVRINWIIAMVGLLLFDNIFNEYVIYAAVIWYFMMHSIDTSRISSWKDIWWFPYYSTAGILALPHTQGRFYCLLVVYVYVWLMSLSRFHCVTIKHIYICTAWGLLKSWHLYFCRIRLICAIRR